MNVNIYSISYMLFLIFKNGVILGVELNWIRGEFFFVFVKNNLY